MKNKVTFYLKDPHKQVVVCHGDYRRVHHKAKEPFTCTSEEWEKVLKSTGKFTRTQKTGGDSK